MEKLSKKLTGFFDVKIYNDRQPRENWKFKGEGDNISFTTTFESGSPEVETYKMFGKEYTDQQGNARVRVTFKIGQRCRWFDENANPIDKPKNEELDGKRFEAIIQYGEVLPDANNPKSPRGYWARAIQIRECVTNPFSSMVEGAVVGFGQKEAEQETTAMDDALPY